VDWNFYTELRPTAPAANPVWRWTTSSGVTSEQTFVSLRDCEVDAMKHGMKDDVYANITYAQPDSGPASPRK
jgi:hypothetical protein